MRRTLPSAVYLACHIRVPTTPPIHKLLVSPSCLHHSRRCSHAVAYLLGYVPTEPKAGFVIVVLRSGVFYFHVLQWQVVYPLVRCSNPNCTPHSLNKTGQLRFERNPLRFTMAPLSPRRVLWLQTIAEFGFAVMPHFPHAADLYAAIIPPDRWRAANAAAKRYH